jgi:uncharacterized protein
MGVRSSALAVALFFCAPAFAEDRAPTVSVVGEAEAEVKPDIAILTLSITIEKPTAADAAAESARVARATIDALKAGGVAEPDIRTVGLSIYPEISGAGSQKRSVAGYQANDSLSVRVRAIDKAGGGGGRGGRALPGGALRRV